MDEPRERPALWNPEAAAAWSIVVMPIGPFLQALNWAALGFPDKAWTGFAWAWTLTGLMVLRVGLAPYLRSIAVFITPLSLALLVAWYMTQGREQAKFVKDHYGAQYERRGWGRPALITIVCLFAYGLASALYLTPRAAV